MAYVTWEPTDSENREQTYQLYGNCSAIRNPTIYVKNWNDEIIVLTGAFILNCRNGGNKRFVTRTENTNIFSNENIVSRTTNIYLGNIQELPGMDLYTF